MFSIFKKHSLAGSGILKGMTDIHTHILPGVDDGVRKLEESLAILEHYEREGVSRIILTPHIMEDYPLNRPEYLQDVFRRVEEAYTGRVTLGLGAEYMLDGNFTRHLDSGGLLTIANDTILVETSCVNEPMAFGQMLAATRSKGYHIVLAHPERYRYMERNDYRRLLDGGVRFQLNLFSLTGIYGEDARKRALELLRSGSYSFLGTDTHNLRTSRNMIGRRCLRSSTVAMLEKIKAL